MGIVMRFVRLAPILLVTTGCATAGVGRLEEILGRAEVTTITASVYAEYVDGRSDSEPEVELEESFWGEVRPRIFVTVAPREGAAQFLREGFRGFLHSYETFLLEHQRSRRRLSFNRLSVLAFLNQARCAGSPCRVPPCCGDGIRCWRCK